MKGGRLALGIAFLCVLQFHLEGQSHRYYADVDQDHFGNVHAPLDTSLLSPPPGFVSDSTDCNDNDRLVFPGSPEQCDNLDNDCNGLLNDGLRMDRKYRDADQDGYGNNALFLDTCAFYPIAGWVENNLDCDDGNPNIHPGAEDVPNNDVDEDCSGRDLIEGPSILPNPFLNTIEIYYDDDHPVFLLVHDVMGRTWIEKEVLFDRGKYILRLEHLPLGIYLLRCYRGLDEELFTFKIRKEGGY